MILFEIAFLLSICLIALVSDWQTKKLLQITGTLNNSQEEKKDNDIHLIILAKSDKFGKRLALYNGVDLLVEKLKNEKQDFILIECDSPESAANLICNPQFKYIYIFGHGSKGKLKFYLKNLSSSNPLVLDYETLSYCRKKFFIAQFHCNTQSTEKSLVEILVENTLITDSFQIDGSRMGMGENWMDINFFIDIPKILALKIKLNTDANTNSDR